MNFKDDHKVSFRFISKVDKNRKPLSKLLLTMKLTALLTFMACVQLQAKVFSQQINLSYKNSKLQTVIQDIRKQTGYTFFYDADYLAKSVPVTIDVKNTHIKEALDKVFSEQSFTYEILDNTILIKAIEEKEEKNIKLQTFDLTGKVLDQDGVPLPGAAINVKGTSIGVVSDVNGAFTLKGVSDTYTLVISFTGFKTQEIKVGSNKQLTISLKEDLQLLSETVVVGYGTQTRSTVTGSISSINAKDIIMDNSPDIGRLLKGKAAGLLVIENSAQPGGGIDIKIRGQASEASSPLIVIDGFPVDEQEQASTGGRYEAGTQSILNSFNPNDIESIEVLKDASATAIYGARAGGGVILITTKKGKEGKITTQYTHSTAFQKYTNQYDLLNLKEWMAQKNDGEFQTWLRYNNVYPYGTKTLEDAMANPGGGLAYVKSYSDEEIANAGPGTDWLSLITRDGKITQHNISMSGGNKGTKLMVSGNYFKHDGVIKKSGLERFSFRANLDQQLSKYVDFGLRLTASRINNFNTQLGDRQYENSGLLRSAIEMGPHILAVDEDGNYPLNPENPNRPNPYSMLTITDRGKVERALLNTFVDIKPFKDFVVTLKVGLDKNFSKKSIYQPKTTLHGGLENGIASVADIDNYSYLYEATAKYKKSINKSHNFDLLLGVSQQKFQKYNQNLGNTGFVMDSFLWYNIGTGTGVKSLSSSGSDNLMASYFSRFNYNFKNKYLFAFTLRTDGASVFARNNKWGTFPSVSAGWNIAEEEWLKDTKLSQLKLRASYGQVGNAHVSVNNNAFAAYYAYDSYLSGNDVITTGVSPYRLENPDLKWETTTSLNLGLDFGIFKDRISGALEYYKNNISDLLALKPLNNYQVVPEVYYNIGEKQSEGYEISLTSVNVNNKNFSWRSTFTFSQFRDTWVKRADNWAPYIYQNDKDPVRAIFSYLSDGILQIGESVPTAQPLLQPGMVKIKDVDGYVRDEAGNPVVDENQRFILLGHGDGRIDEADNRMIGTRDPKLLGGMNHIFTYKNFRLNLDFNGLFGRRIVDPNYVSFGVSAEGRINRGFNALKTIEGRWTPTNPSTTQPSGFVVSEYGYGDFFYQDAWFIRLQNASLGYDIPKKFLKNKVSAVQLNVGGSNLFVITPYKGIDPETDSYTAAYPNVRTFTVGLNVTF